MARTVPRLRSRVPASRVLLPLHVPEVYEVHRRRVGGRGYVSLHTNRYPVPDTLTDRRIQLHDATKVEQVLRGVDPALGASSTPGLVQRATRVRRSPAKILRAQLRQNVRGVGLEDCAMTHHNAAHIPGVDRT
jgi:hypothetical protein